MYLLLGLGNIGSEYKKTRHNFGFLVLDKIIEDYNLKASGLKFSSEIFSGEIAGEKIIALKPQTYMNNSGAALLAAVQFYKIPTNNIIVFHDDIDLPLGKIKVKIGGGNAGHNGLKSLDAVIGKDYWRVRLGVDRPINAEFDISDYVLAKFSRDEMKVVAEIVQNVSNSLIEFILNKV